MRIWVKRLAITVCFLNLGLLAYAGDQQRNSFEAGGVIWTIELGQLESFDSELAGSALEVSSDSGEMGHVQSAWIGDEPGDLGPMWIIENEEREVIGACWTFYGESRLECIPLYVPATFSLD